MSTNTTASESESVFEPEYFETTETTFLLSEGCNIMEDGEKYMFDKAILSDHAEQLYQTCTFQRRMFDSYQIPRSNLNKVVKLKKSNIKEQKTDFEKRFQELEKRLKHTEEEWKKTKDELKETQEELKKTRDELKETKDELKETQEELKKTKDELKETQDELKKTRDELKKTKDELKETQEELKKTRDELKETQDCLKEETLVREIEVKKMDLKLKIVQIQADIDRKKLHHALESTGNEYRKAYYALQEVFPLPKLV